MKKIMQLIVEVLECQSKQLNTIDARLNCIAKMMEQLPTKKPCLACGGVGVMEHPNKVEICFPCNGTGRG